ncbi:Heptaprenyl diphosphate synthase component I [Chitinispirillum alkaliphilum]|nr:Heptaprenyl diphosphate synthase component I [Chitinispirillum alkaliphilum]
MQSLTEPKQNSQLATKTSWLLLAIAINALELAFPRLPFLPWLKPGLSNVITMIWIIKYGTTDAVLFTVLRVWISGFYFGFSLLTLSLGLGGGVLSTCAMGILWSILGKRNHLGTVGLGMVGALFHNLGQLGVVYLFMARNFRIFYQLPFMIIAAMILGSMVGALVPVFIRILPDPDISENDDTPKINRKISKTCLRDKLAATLMLTVSIALLFTTDYLILLSAVAVISIICLKIDNWNWRTILFPLKFYWIFLFTGFIHLIFSYGTSLDAVPFLTIEGLQKTAVQWLRLWAWLEATHIFRKFRFHDLFFSLIGRAFPHKSSTLDAGIIALELFPETISGVGKKRSIKSVVNFIRKPSHFLRVQVDSINLRIASAITEPRQVKE